MKSISLHFHIFNMVLISLTLFSSMWVNAQNGSVELQTTTVTPAPKTVYGNSTPLAYGTCLSSGLLQSEYGVSSVTRTSTGIYEILLDHGFIGQAVVNTTIRFGGIVGQSITNTYESDAATKTITAYFANGTSPANQAFSFVIYGTPLNFGSGCPSDTSGTGFAQAPNDILRFNAVEDANCVIDIPFAFSDPATVKVNVKGFVGGGTSTVEVDVDFNPAVGTPTAQTVNLTNAGLVLNLGQYTGNNGTPYTTWLDLTYDGSQFVTARVRMDAL